VAISAFKLHGRASWTAANWLHVDGMIELDRAGTAHGSGGIQNQCYKFRMAVFQAANAGSVSRGTAMDAEIGMTFCAGLIAGGRNAYAAFVLGMTFGAGEFFSPDDTDRVVNWAVMAIETSGVRGFGGKSISLLDVACGALFLEHSMCHA
jgi:hypothetical protein